MISKNIDEPHIGILILLLIQRIERHRVGTYCMITNNENGSETGEMVQQLRSLAILPEDQSLISSTHMVVLNYL